MSDAILHRLRSRAQDLGGFDVRRLLPAAACRNVGPFIFLDHIGPAQFAPGGGIDVRPHPHIGLATVTYLFEGAMLHRDSLGVVQEIRPGDVNWMTAGRGIVHSERTPEKERAEGMQLHGLQFWVALPLAHEEAEPAFRHCPAASLPVLEGRGHWLRLIAGAAFGLVSPAPALSPLFYADLHMEAGSDFLLPAEHAERALYVLEGELVLDDETLPVQDVIVLAPGQPLRLDARTGVRVMLFGGEPLDAPRHMWWNLVSSRPERIEQAKADWADDRFPAVPGESERIPLPPR
ncbi:MAG: pirin family protein [Moraxellaceae bacterium]|nr:pirin family protein [Moraxellaceae bacterium]